jgi:hypothetical protein
MTDDKMLEQAANHAALACKYGGSEEVLTRAFMGLAVAAKVAAIGAILRAAEKAGGR